MCQIHWRKQEISYVTLLFQKCKYLFFDKTWRLCLKQECVHSTRMAHSHYHFLCSVDREIGIKTIILALQLERSYHREHVYKFQLFGLQLHQKLPWQKTLTWSGTDGQTKGRTKGRTNERTYRPENIMPLFYRRWGIKTKLELNKIFII